MWDLLICDGWVIDGAGNPWYRADIGIRGDRIVAIHPALRREATTIISAAGRVVCPGFIDMHSHSDWWMIATPHLEPKVQQGITTELLGQDGFSLGPLMPERAAILRRLIAGMAGDPDVPISWDSIAGYLEALSRVHPSVNAGCLVGHGTIRLAVMGMANSPPTGAQLTSMQDLVDRAMDEGAAGLSTGLLYAPCYYADSDELSSLAQVVAKHHGILVVHLRSEGDRLLTAIDEMLEVCSRSGASLHISHLKVFGAGNWGTSQAALERLEAARDGGIDVTFDQYPYTAGSTGLIAVLPPWVTEGGPAEIMRRLCSEDDRLRIIREIETDSTWENLLKGAGAENMIISWVRSQKNKGMEGRSISAIAASLKKEEVAFVLDLLVEENLEVAMINHSQSEMDMRRILQHPLGMVSTDSILLGKSHPRAYGTYPRVLGRYVREEKLLPLEQAIRKMTSLPAQRLRLRDRGLIRENAYADIVIFDPAKILDRATFVAPQQYPTGIDFVIVNGGITVAHGRHLGTRAGRVLKPARSPHQ